MGSRQFIVFGFVFAFVRLSDARFLSVAVPTYWGAETQKPAKVEAKLEAGPEREHSRKSAQQAGWLHAKLSPPEVQPFSWKFPEVPVDPVKKPPFNFQLRQPVRPSRLAVRCGESKIQVEVSQDLLGNGKLIKPEEITLGGFSATEVDELSHVLAFECELHSCGSTLMVGVYYYVYYILFLKQCWILNILFSLDDGKLLHLCLYTGLQPRSVGHESHHKASECCHWSGVPLPEVI